MLEKKQMKSLSHSHSRTHPTISKAKKNQKAFLFSLEIITAQLKTAYIIAPLLEKDPQPFLFFSPINNLKPQTI
jgi:hypothetical protein